MGYYLKIGLCCLSLVTLATSGAVGSGLPSSQDTIKQIILQFPFDNSEIDSVFLDNARNLTNLHDVMTNPALTSSLDSIIIIGSTSTEDSHTYSLLLAKKRAEALESYITEKYPDVAKMIMDTRIKEGGYWDEFIKIVREDPDIPGRDELLMVIEDPDLSNNTKNQHLAVMLGGKTFQYLSSNGILSHLRTASVVVYLYYTSTEPESEVITEEMVVDTPVFEIQRGGLIALRTNLLTDIMAGRNIGIEIPVGNHFSVAAVFNYAHTKINNLYTMQTIDGGIEGRYWFHRNDQPLTGWNTGLYGTLGGRYDIQWMDGLQGDRFWSVGVIGGYSLPISPSFNLNFSLAAGFLGSPEARYYERPRNGYLIWKETHYNAIRFSLTKIQVNLVWLINTSKKTGN